MTTATVPTGPTFTTTEICREVGISFRQADYWDRTGLLTPTVALGDGPGSRRLYNLDDVFVLRVILELRRVGITVQSRVMRDAVALLPRPAHLAAGMALLIGFGPAPADDHVRLVPIDLRLDRDVTVALIPLDPLIR